MEGKVTGRQPRSGVNRVLRETADRLFSYVTGRPTRLLGVDIGSSVVRILELGGGGLQNYVICKLPAGAVVEKHISDTLAVGDCIARAVDTLAPSTRHAATAVPGSAVITRSIEMSASCDEEEVENRVMAEAGRCIPYPLDEVCIDFERQAPTTDDGQRVTVQLAACRRENVEARAAALERGGLFVEVVDTEPCAIERAFALTGRSAGPEGGRCVAIVDIDVGSMTATLNVILDGHTIYTREQRFGGDIPPTELRAHPHGAGTGAALASFRAAVARQVNQTLQFFYSSSNHTRVDLILLAGAVADGLPEMVREQLLTPAQAANPFTGMVLGRRVDRATLHRDAPALLIACGLAMRGWH